VAAPPIGSFTTLASTPLCVVSAFAHDRARAHRDPPEERFTATEMIVTTAGAWSIATGSGGGEVGPGVIVAGERGDAYRCEHRAARPDDTTVDIAFRPEAIARLLATADGERLVDDRGRLFARAVVDLDGHARNLVAALLAELRADRPGRSLAIDALASRLLLEGARARHREPPSSRRQRGLALAAADYMAAHLDEPLDLTQLGRVTSVSPWHLSRIFTQTFGISPRQYLIRLRIDEAARLLAEEDVTVSEVAARTGFRSLAHFRATFRRLKGTAPGCWRRDGARRPAG
jgi:AraC-like DNA-binding protein